MRKLTSKQVREKRDSGPVVVIPHCVLNSEAYITLSSNAIRLLFDIAQQYNKWNNGALLASFRYMSEKRGWKSADMLSKAKAELLERDLLIQTVQGQRPNKASWYAMGWWELDKIIGLEISEKNFPRSSYRNWTQTNAVTKRKPPAQETRKAHYERLREKNSVVRTTDK